MAPADADAFLTEALSRTGRDALPYSGEFAFLVHQHLLELVADFPALRLKIQSYTHTDGRTTVLLCAEGTVPMHYGGHKYNIPVAVWLPDKYPLQRPIVYVVPTHNMIIKPRHPIVDGSGLVNSPYLGHWAYPRSNLQEMAQDMSMLFGSDPPLYSKPPNHPSPSHQPSSGAMSTSSSGGAGAMSPTPTGSYHLTSNGGFGPGSPGGDAFVNPIIQGSSSGSFTTHQSGGAAGTSSAGGLLGGLWAGAVAAAEAIKPSPRPGQSQPQQQEQAAAVQQQKHTQDSLMAAFRAAAVTELTKRLQASLAAVASQTAGEAHRQMDLQGELRRREAVLEQEVQALQDERLAIDKLAHDLAASNQQLDAWLAENEPRAAALTEGSLDPDNMLTAADPLSQHALEVQAEDLALEDCLYALDRALQGGSVSPEVYLRQVRAVCRQQFTGRVLGLKIAAAQQERQRQERGAAPFAAGGPSGAAGAPAPLRMVLPQGDSWSNTGVFNSGVLANPLAAAAQRL